MENQNKPEWLLKAEQEQAKFNETKWANYTDAQIDQVHGGAAVKYRYDSEYQSKMGKLGGAKGAAVAQANLRAEYGDDYNKEMKSRLYDKIKNKKDFHSKGGVAAGKNAADKRDAILIPYFEKLERGVWLTKKELEELFSDCEVYMAAHKFKIYHKDKYTSNGARGKNARIKLNN